MSAETENLLAHARAINESGTAQRREWLLLIAALADALEAAEVEVEKAHAAMAHWLGKANDAEAEVERLADDEAVMRGVAAVRRMLMLRVGGQHEHAEAFRDALAAGGRDEPTAMDDGVFV